MIDTEEEILIALNAGIIPVQMFYSKISKGLNPFEGISETKSKELKRRWRKLKKKYSVKSASLATASFKIRRHLKENFVDEKN